MSRKLGRDFYRQPTLEVARQLIGKVFVVKQKGDTLSGRIVEAEAYIGETDPVCHARFGLTRRNSIMYGDGGFTYVYFVYGMYNMLNFVTEHEGFPAAVLIRAIQPLEGIKLMQKRRHQTDLHQLTSGPGKLCQAFGITVKDTGRDLTQDEWSVIDNGNPPKLITSAARVGIKEGNEHLWRFYDGDSKFVSRT